MKKTFFSLFTLLLCLIAAGLQAQQVKTGRYNIIPQPTVLQPADGIFTVNSQTSLVLAPGAAIFTNEQAFLKRILGSYLGAGTLSGKKTAGSNTIVLKYDPAVTASEAYKLVVGPGRVTLSAKTPAGMFYAVETLRQLLPADVEIGKGKTLTIPAVKIEDQPAFQWRGMMLDVSRHFFSVEYLQKYVDMMALYKLNKLHLHLTDDQGWRIEIKKYPDLTNKSAWRTFNNQDTACMKMAKETGNPDMNIDQKHIIQKDGKTLYGGSYTQEQMKQFIRYAAKRHVEVIPEIDMPGHMMAAVKIYPSLTCDSTLGDGRGFSNPICPCNPDVLQFAKDIFSEIADLFPSKYIHIGGDEVDMRNWEKSPVCQAFMKEKGFTKLAQLQSYFNDYMQKFFRSKEKTLLGWDEIIEGDVDSSAVVMFWRPWAKDAPLNATKNHNKVIMTPDGPLYFDAFPNNNSLNEVYNYNPLDAMYRLNKEEETRIIGVQANLWTEMIPSEQRADYMIMPRMTALAEVGWTYRTQYESYLQRLTMQYERLDNLNVNYRMPDLDGLVENNVFVGKTSFFVAPPLKYFTIRYTTDGSGPSSTSPVMDKAILIDHTLALKLALFTPTGRAGDVYTLHFTARQYAPSEQSDNLQNGIKTELYKKRVNQTAKITGTADSVYQSAAIVLPASAGGVAEFALKFSGYINVPETGIYTFYLNCNDGGVLHIDNNVLIDNDGLHPDREKGSQAALQKGLHRIALEYFAAAEDDRLELKYIIGNNGKPQIVPPSWFEFSK